MESITLVVPCYNEEDVIVKFYQECEKVFLTMRKNNPNLVFDYIFVDDGSTDSTLFILQNLRKENQKVGIVSFSRNFGKEAGILAGLEHAKGDYILLLDADLQHPPSLLPEMYRIMKKNSELDCVAAQRTRVGDSPVRSLFSRIFYKIFNYISEVELKDGVGDFRLMSRRMVNTIISLPEKQRFSKGLFSWVGFSTEYLPYENIERTAGETKWSFSSLFSYAWQGFFAFSHFPMRIPMFFSSLFGIGSVVLIFFIIVNIFIRRWPFSILLIALVVFLILCVIFLCLGLVGYLLELIYKEVQSRPVYISQILLLPQHEEKSHETENQ